MCLQGPKPLVYIGVGSGEEAPQGKEGLLPLVPTLKEESSPSNSASPRPSKRLAGVPPLLLGPRPNNFSLLGILVIPLAR